MANKRKTLILMALMCLAACTRSGENNSHNNGGVYSPADYDRATWNKLDSVYLHGLEMRYADSVNQKTR